MMMLSVVPGIGAALVWFPAVVYLAFNGQWLYAGSLFAFCGLLVGTIDNVLRPKLVGNDTQLHELMIFFSTIGGLLTFGFSGFIIGPIIAALFVTVWEIYGVEFKSWLPETGFSVLDQRRGDPIAKTRQEILDTVDAHDALDETADVPVGTSEKNGAIADSKTDGYNTKEDGDADNNSSKP